ncbi:3-hydroxyisobutyryl-CoA hydrolase, mitochondrial [Mycena indigotica]|uniref:3-hydroxyisobutyryl-CoA hydrolase n=1 Tax=Mycena indigotica TaxID=2126181 RepID=A0A8H6S9W1_9AGAR|nr:3-hydroxyisobutyryl-CoA hydrolase, mitochondrial [Mycena indigotica]KAF7295519.1 3-hydroxyisobutyryl-CoA hydrolase, mitochondrial [Mycena indigotica]
MLLAATRLMSRRALAASRAGAIARHMSSEAPEPVVRFETTLGVRNYILNRPNKLNALNDEMLDILRPKIEEWDDADLCTVIVGSGTGRAFCAGGDVESVVRSAGDVTTRHKAVDFFKREFELDLLLASLRKPYVALLDGITMGGGVGLVANAPFRIATEKTVFSMPETNIGYCPDVGASYFLSRLDGELGTYLALTSDKLVGRAVFEHGFATHYIPSRRIPLLMDRLSTMEHPDHVAIDRTLEELSHEREQEDPPPPFVDATRAAMDIAFGHDRVEAIFSDLELLTEDQDPSISQWAVKTLETLKLRSPTSLKVALKAIRLGKTQSLTEALNMELKIATAFCNGASPDFTTGVTAVLMTKSKDRPDWKPSTVEEVSDQIVERFFSPHSPYIENTPTIGSAESFGEVPRGASERMQMRFALPTEDEIRDVITGADPDSGDMGYTVDDLLEYFHDTRAGKAGMTEKILEVVRRKTIFVDNQDGNFVWLRWDP